MAQTNTALPYGLRDVKLFPLTGEVAGDGVDLPNARTFSFSEAEDFEELRGDDAVVAVRGKGASVNWNLESGGTPFEAIKTMFGGAILETGTTPNQVKRFRKSSTNSRPYFKVEGKAISDSGGDFHVILYRCRCTGELAGDMADGAFWLTATSGRAIGRESDGLLYDFVQNESEDQIDVTPALDETQTLTITGTPTGGTWTLMLTGDTPSAAVSWNPSAAAVQQALEATPAVGVGNVVVTGAAGGPFTVHFVGDLAATDVPALVVDVTLLTPSGGVTVVETVKGG